MYLVSTLDKRQSQMPPPDSADGSQTANDSRMPNYVWAVVVFFILAALFACFYAQRKHRRRYLMHQAALAQHYPPGSYPTQRPDRGWILDSAAAAAGIRRPARAARPNFGRRGSQASITSLPVYMENPGAQEVVLMQRTAPKEVEAADERDRANDSRPSSMAHSSPTTTTLPVIAIIPPSAPLSPARHSTNQYPPPSSPPPQISTLPTAVPFHPSTSTDSYATSSPSTARQETTPTSTSSPIENASNAPVRPPSTNTAP